MRLLSFGFAARVLAATALVLLSACSSKPTTPEPVQVQPVVRTPLTPASPQVRAQLHTELASGYYERGQMDVALNELTQAVAADPNYAQAYNIYGLVYATLGEDQKSQQNFGRALQLAPADPEIRQNWGWYLCTHNRARDSLPEFEAAVRDPLYKTPEIALVNAGRCAESLGDLQLAEQYFRRALGVQPSYAQASYSLARLSYRERRYDDARAWMKNVMLTSNPPPEGLLLGMCVERKLGDRTAELSYVSQLKNRYPEAPETKNLATEKCE